ncbi:MAG TPA: hypothetical protein VK151_14290 [Fluviicola sp.]|nr:hypothetical protein [Fluviicola sp.]
MQTTILIPTDFTIESISLLKVALQEYPNEELKIVFVHGIYLPDSIQELMFFSRSKTLAQLENADFTEACAVLQNKFSSQIVSIVTELFTGKNQSAFHNFLSANKIDVIISPNNHLLKSTLKTSMDLLPFIHKARTAKIYTDWEARPVIPEKDKLAEIFAL